MQAPNGMTQDVPISPMEESYDGMTVAEWDDLGLPMKWSIFKDDGDDVPFEQRQLDLSAPVEDGEYDAVYGSGDDEKRNPFRELDYDGRVDGIIVEGGAFIARPTSEAIYDLVRTFQSGRYGEIVRHGEDMNHEYIEKIDWNPIGGYFRVETGS